MNEFVLENIEEFSLKKLNELISEKNIIELKRYMENHGLCVKDGKIVPKKEYEERYEYFVEYYDKRQLVKKILLNSAYGGLLNIHCRWFMHSIGQSTTLSGRCVTRHMGAKINELIGYTYNHNDPASVYFDTDSCYFTAYPKHKDKIENKEMTWTRDSVIEYYDDMADKLNKSFPSFMLSHFNVPPAQNVIKAGREIIAENTLFIKKKRYAAMYYIKDNKRYDTNGKYGKLKAMGLDLRRSDTPKIVQKFLVDTLQNILEGKSVDGILADIKNFKTDFNKLPAWEMGTPKAANGVTTYNNKLIDYNEAKSNGIKTTLTVPGHIRASMNWNSFIELYNDLNQPKIKDGAKIIVCPLKDDPINNPYGYTSVAYPVDIVTLPAWFTELPFDTNLMMETVVDQKIENMIGILKLNLSKANASHDIKLSIFDFED